jgi:hypothetical protein
MWMTTAFLQSLFHHEKHRLFIVPSCTESFPSISHSERSNRPPVFDFGWYVLFPQVMLRCKLPPSRSTFSQNNATSEIITISRASNWAKSTAGLFAAQCTLYILTHNHLSEVWRSIQLIQLWSLLSTSFRKGKAPVKWGSFQCSGNANIEVPFCLVFHFRPLFETSLCVQYEESISQV